MITTCVASTDRYLTTTSFVKSVMGIVTTSDDATISAQILAASKWAESFIGYPLTVQTYQETLAGYGRRTVRTQYTPLRSVQRLFNGGTDTGTNTEIQTSEFRVEDADAGMLSLISGGGFSWTAGGVGPGQFGWGSLYTGPEASIPLSPFTPLPGEEERPYLVEYVAGYTLKGVDTGSANYSTVQGSTSTGRTLPEDIELAVALRVQQYREGSVSVASESLGDMSVNYRSESAADTMVDAQRPEGLLVSYRRVW